MDFRPINGNLLCKRLCEDEIKTASGIILDNTVKTGEQLIRAVILAIAENDDLKLGDIIHFSRNKADAVKLNDENIEEYIIKDYDIEAVEE